MNKILLLIIASLFLLLLPTQGLAVGEQYTQGFKWASDSFFFTTDNVKVACHPDTIHCVAILWDNTGTFTGKRVHVYYSTDYFQTVLTDELIDTYVAGNCPYTFDDYNWTEFYTLPMDIIYRETDGKYWISIGTKMYTFVMEDSPKVQEQYDLGNRIQILKLFDDNEMYVAIWRDDTGGDIEADIRWLVNGSVKELWGNIDTGVTPNCVGSPCVHSALAVRSYVPRDKTLANTSAIFHLKTNTWIPVGGCFSSYFSGTLYSTDWISPSFPIGYDAIWYYLNDYAYFHNTSATESGVYRTRTIDFSSYSAVETVYVENASVEESIRFADGRLTDNANVFQNVRKNNRTAPLAELNGTYAYKEDLSIVSVLSWTEEPFTGAITPVNTTGILTCDAENYTYTDSGTDYDLFSLCDTNVNVSINSMSVRPISTSIMFDIDTLACPTTFIDAFFYQPYNIPISITDSVTGDPVVGAEVQLDATINITDSNGTAYFTVDPISSPELYAEVDSNCYKRYKPTGEPRLFSLQVKKAGYINTTDFITLAEVNPITNKTVLARFYQQRLVPSAVNLFVHIYTNDLVELEYETADNAVVFINGSNETRWLFGEDFQTVNFAYVFPAEFYLFDDRDNYTITLNLTLWGGLYNETKTQFVQRDLTFHVDFILPYLLHELPCNLNTDCQESSCSGSTYRKLTGCINQTCQYSVTECPLLCDERIGCYNLEEGTVCDDDRACLNTSLCSASYRSLMGVCGSDGFCKLKEMNCQNECNFTTGLCDEAIICLEAGYVRQRFLVKTPVRNYLDVDYYCGIDNTEERQCISGVTIPSSEVELGLVSYPENWQYVQSGSNYVFSDMSIECDVACNTTWEFCPYGCDPETKTCLRQPTSTESVLRGFIQTGYWWWGMLFPTSAEQTFMYIIIVIIVSGGIAYGVGSKSKDAGMIFLALSVIFVGIGTIIPTVTAPFIPFFVTLGYVIIAMWLLLRAWRGGIA